MIIFCCVPHLNINMSLTFNIQGLWLTIMGKMLIPFYSSFYFKCGQKIAYNNSGSYSKSIHFFGPHLFNIDIWILKDKWHILTFIGSWRYNLSAAFSNSSQLSTNGIFLQQNSFSNRLHSTRRKFQNLAKYHRIG